MPPRQRTSHHLRSAHTHRNLPWKAPRGLSKKISLLKKTGEHKDETNEWLQSLCRHLARRSICTSHKKPARHCCRSCRRCERGWCASRTSLACQQQRPISCAAPTPNETSRGRLRGGFPRRFLSSRKPGNTKTKPTSGSSPCVGTLRGEAFAHLTRSPRVVVLLIILVVDLLRPQRNKGAPTGQPSWLK